ncbi:wall-associated receptor kinase 2-like protein [Tanacetum coccineum]
MLLHFILCLFTFPSSMALGTLQCSNSSAMNNIAKPGCQTHCGNITVPYPLGIGKDTGCSLNASFYLTCNTSFNPPKLYLNILDLNESRFEIYNISDSELHVFTSIGSKCYDQYGNVTNDYDFSYASTSIFVAVMDYAPTYPIATGMFGPSINVATLFLRVESSVLVVIDWAIGDDRNCSQATECKENSECHDADGGGYHCRCNQGYEGNPYLDQGRQGCLTCMVDGLNFKDFVILLTQKQDTSQIIMEDGGEEDSETASKVYTVYGVVGTISLLAETIKEGNPWSLMTSRTKISATYGAVKCLPSGQK